MSVLTIEPKLGLFEIKFHQNEPTYPKLQKYMTANSNIHIYAQTNTT